MSWSIEEHIGECRPFPAQVVVYKGETGECLAYVSGEVADRLKAENAKLRGLVSILSVINKNMSQCNVTDCNQCPVSNECNESVYLEGLLGIDTKEISWRVQWRNEDSSDTQKENVKLRELVRLLLRGVDNDMPRDEELVWSQKVDALTHELGVTE